VTDETTGARGRHGTLFVLCLLPFVLLCTLNSAGYRYGASDQAFYVPAVLARLNPLLFPRDGRLIESQARLTRIDETMAAAVHATGAELPTLYASLYIASLVLLAAAGWLTARYLYRTRWAGVAFLAALTLRHAIAKSGTNSLEAYFHPRQLAFGLGAVAVALFLRGGLAMPAGLVAGAALLHPTTALWFAVWLAVSTAVSERRLRLPIAGLAVGAAAAGAWALTAGPLAGRLVVMDAEWLATLETKDYLFPIDWPWDVWLLNLSYIPVIALIYRHRARIGLARPRERAVVIGCLSLLAIFAAGLPLTAAHVALAVQLQTPRVFWMLDFLAIGYAVWAMAEGRTGNERRAMIAAAVIAVLSLTRGLYVMFVRFPDRAVAQVRFVDNDWGRTMAWARATEPGSGWLADPMHAVRYGTSLRVAGERDVLVEGIKDAAIGMYTREIAMRTKERIAAAGVYDLMTGTQALALGQRYGLDYMITEQPLDLPLAFQSGPLRIYRLGAAPAAGTDPPR
jgi:hypothetical protein